MKQQLKRDETKEKMEDFRMHPMESAGSSISERQATSDVQVCQMWNEQDLIKKAQQNDERALTELYERYFDRIYRYITLKTGDPHEAEDITQEVFLKALQAINTYRCRGTPLSSWLYRIAHNQIVDHLRQKKRRPSVLLDETLAGSVYSLDNPQTMVEIRSDVEQLINAVSKLTPAQREVIALRFSSDLSLAQVALLMGKNVGAIKSLQYNAVVMLRKRMLGVECK